jgi:hypothetical protein
MESAFCTDVDVDGLTVDGDTLTVPTSAAATDRLADICEELVGSDLLATATAEGVVHVVVVDDGGEQAGCEFDSGD